MSSDQKKNEQDRRSFLKTLLVGTGVSAASAPLDMFISNMMVHFLQRGTAFAAGNESAALSDMKFISLILAGGAPRYYWDYSMRPNGDDPFTPNPMVITKFNKTSNDVLGAYALTKIGSTYMPYVWEGNIATVGGGSVPMRNLAQNMAVIRGIDLQIDSHDIDRARQVSPIPGSVSLSGLAADQAKTPIPAVGRGGGGSYYRSGKGIAYFDMAGSNPLTAALAPFSQDGSLHSLKNNQIEGAIDNALSRMSAMSANKHKYLPSTFETRQNAKKLMKQSFGNLQGEYNSLVAKYRSLINRSFEASGDLSLAGIDDIQNPGSTNARSRLTENEYYSGPDMRVVTDINTNIDNLAESMAVAEYMIKNALSSSVNVVAGGFANIFVSELTTKATGAIRSAFRTAHTMDVHFTGSHLALILFSRYYRAVSSCLYELSSQLRSVPSSAGNLFNQTVMTVTSEFNRQPRTDGSGADHGWQGSNFTILSGMIDQLIVRGNTAKDSAGGKGSWGLAGGLPELSGREAIIGNAASTVANLLGVSSPTPNDQPFIIKKNGKAIPVISSCGNKEEG